MSLYKELIISSEELKSNNIIQKCIVLKPDDKITIYSKVVYSTGEILKNVVVGINKIDKNYMPEKITNLGYITTNKYGEFCISLEKVPQVYYSFEIFQPLEKVCDKSC